MMYRLDGTVTEKHSRAGLGACAPLRLMIPSLARLEDDATDGERVGYRLRSSISWRLRIGVLESRIVSEALSMRCVEMGVVEVLEVNAD